MSICNPHNTTKVTPGCRCKTCHRNAAERPSSRGWEREWAYVQARANAPRPPSLGCSTVSHERLGYCAGCVPALRDGGPNGWCLEANGWRLLALAPDPATKGSSVTDSELSDDATRAVPPPKPTYKPGGSTDDRH